MLIKPDKPPSQTTSYRPISLLSAIMKLFEWVIEKRLWKHLEDNGFFSKYQSGFRKSKSTNDHLFRLSQTIIESFNRGEHVIAAFLDVEKAFNNVWHNGLRYKIYQLDLPIKLCRWLSDFLVGRVIQVKIEDFLSPKVYPKASVPQGSNLSPLLFLIYVNDMPNPSHHQTDKSQFADDAGQWAVSRNIDLAAEYLQRDLDKLARWCAKWRIKLNPEKTKVIIFSKSRFAIRAEPALSLYGDLLSYGSRTKSPQTKPPRQNPPDKIPLDKISPRTKSPRTKCPWTKSPHYILYTVSPCHPNPKHFLNESVPRSV